MESGFRRRQKAPPSCFQNETTNHPRDLIMAKIDAELLRKHHANGLTDIQIGAAMKFRPQSIHGALQRSGLVSNTTRDKAAVELSKARQAHARENAIERGKGGDAEFARLLAIAGDQFSDTPRARPSRRFVQAFGHTSSPARSYTGCAASLACV